MDCWISQHTVVPCVANRKRWLRSPRQWAVLLPYALVAKQRLGCCLRCHWQCGYSSSSCLATPPILRQFLGGWWIMRWKRFGRSRPWFNIGTSWHFRVTLRKITCSPGCVDPYSNQPPLYERPKRYRHTNLLCPFLESGLSIILPT